MASRFTIKNPNLKQVTFDLLDVGFKDLGVSNVTISLGDPETWAELPMVSLNLTSDSEVNTHIGSSLDDELLTDEEQVYGGVTAIFSQVVEATLWTQNKEQRDRIGELLKQVLLLYGQGTSTKPGPYVTTPGLSEVRITGGADQGVVDTSGQYAPHPLHLRTYYVSGLVEVTGQEATGGPVTDVYTLGEGYQVDLFADLEDRSRPSL